MARTKEEREALREELEREEREEAERAKGGGRTENLEIVIDLADEAAVTRGLELGYLKRSDVENGGEGGGEGEGEGEGEGKGKAKAKAGEKSPRRAGYFDSGDQ